MIKDLFEYIDEYAASAESENFKLLIDVYKENYKQLNNNDSFVSNYGQVIIHKSEFIIKFLI